MKINLYKPHSRRTATRDIVEMFVKKKESLKKWLHTNQQRVSLTTDIWVFQMTGKLFFCFCKMKLNTTTFYFHYDRIVFVLLAGASYGL